MRLFTCCLLAGSALVVLCAGCSSPNSQLTRIQQDKEQLLAAIGEQRSANRALREQVVSLESRLDQSEKELARSGGGTRLSSKPSSTAPTRSGNSLPPPRGEPLPWRAPASKNERGTSPAADSRSLSGPSLQPATGSLAALAARDSRVQLDARSGAAQLRAPLEFDTQNGTLTAQSKRELDQVARLLRSEEARGLKIVIADPGSPARAQAVADYLDRHGIATDRLQVSSTPAPSAGTGRGAAGGVQIQLSESERPLRR
jgi:outer membrane protein OmpA-like peptidoglycan-associated protein